MASYRQIAIVLGITVIIIIGIGFWLGGKNAPPEESLLEGSSTLPAPLSPEELKVNNPSIENKMNHIATLQTSMGTIKLELYEDKMPITTANFIKLANEGFYDNTKFHRVIDGFMIQGGDPNTKTDEVLSYGKGGPGYTIQDEFVSDPLLSNTRGSVAMANTGQPNSGGSQFFINVADNTFLDFDKDPPTSKHPVFGRVIEGMDVVDAISKVKTDATNNMPLDPVTVSSVTISAQEATSSEASSTEATSTP